MNKHLHKIWALLLAASMLFALAACGGGAADSGAAPAAGSEAAASGDTTVTVGVVSVYYYFNPCGGGQGDVYAPYLIFDNLFTVDDNGNYYSPISDDWGWDDETTLRVTVKDGITYADGTVMDANDILATFRYNVACANQRAGFWNGVIDLDSSYVSEDGKTVYLKYFKVYGPALSEICMPVIDDEYLAAHPDSDEVWWTGPMGSGPYRVKEVVNGSYITYERRDDYWDTSKTFDCSEITVRYYSDANTLWADYQNGVVDVVLGLDDTQVKAVQDGTVDGTLVLKSTKNVPCMVMYEGNEFLSDIEVRKAISHAVDWAAVGVIAYGSLATPATSHFTTEYPFYKAHEGYEYDPELARQILADAGYSDGDIVLSYVAVNTTGEVRVMEAVQGYLEAVGITVECNSYELMTALSQYYWQPGGNDLGLLTALMANYQCEPWTLLSATYNGLFVDRTLTAPEYVELLEEGLGTTDQEARNAAYAKLDDWLYENYWFFPYCEINEAWCFNSRVAALDMINAGYDCLGNIKLA